MMLKLKGTFGVSGIDVTKDSKTQEATEATKER